MDGLLQGTGVEFDSTSGLNMVPTADLTPLKNHVQKTQLIGQTCTILNNRVECPCSYLTNLDQAYPELRIKIGQPSE